MKKLTAMLLCFAILLPLAACNTSRCQNPVNFYYRRSEPTYGSGDGLIAPETRELCKDKEDLEPMLRSYFAGPESRSLESPFPRDLSVQSWNLTGRALYLDLGDSFALLSGVDLTVACSCIARTFLELLPVEEISISAGRKPLNGHRSVLLSRDSMRFSDDTLAQLQTSYTLYFMDSRKRYLVGVDTSASLADRADTARFLVSQLMSTPFSSDLIAPIPYGTKLLDVTVKGNLCTLDFSREFETMAWPQPEAQRATLLCIVNTLTQVEGVTQVEFCTEGNLLVQYGSLNISAPFVQEEQAIGPVRSGINEFDTTLYLSNGSDQYLTGVPVKLRHTVGFLQEELVLNALIHYAPLNGFASCISSDTELRSIYTDNGICTIDLSEEFLRGPAPLELAVHSVVASVCSVKGVKAVRITIEGGIPRDADASLFEALTPQSDWFI